MPGKIQGKIDDCTNWLNTVKYMSSLSKITYGDNICYKQNKPKIGVKSKLTIRGYRYPYNVVCRQNSTNPYLIPSKWEGLGREINPQNTIFNTIMLKQFKQM